MSDLTSIDAVKKAAQRALDHFRATFLAGERDETLFALMIVADSLFSFFIAELEEAMRNPRSPP